MVHLRSKAIQRLSLREVDDLWNRACDRCDVFPFDFLSFSESTLEFLHLFLHVPK